MINLTPDQCRAARGFLNWSREELAKASGVSPETIKNFETGKYHPEEASEAALIVAFELYDLQFIKDGIRREPSLPAKDIDAETHQAP
jgi:DNA-binding XRE family transcriptional regulator